MLRETRPKITASTSESPATVRTSPGVSIVIPALNEERGIRRTLDAIPRQALEDMGYWTQVIVVDNGSTDSTAEIAKAAGAEVVSEPRRGYGSAYKAGFAQVQGSIIATADADCTYPMEEIPRFVEMIEVEGLDFITGNRFGQEVERLMPLSNRVGNAVLTFAFVTLFRLNLADSQSGMWVFRRELLDRMKLRADSMALSEEIKIEACRFCGSEWKEVPIKYADRVGDVKLRRWRDGLGNLLFLIRKRIIR